MKKTLRLIISTILFLAFLGTLTCCASTKSKNEPAKVEEKTATPSPAPVKQAETEDPGVILLFDESLAIKDTGSKAFTCTSATEVVKRMTVGWNLGNTLDATGGSGLSSETSWGQPTTTKAMLAGVRKAGFKTIRIPVSWAKHTSGSDYTIDSAWMNRVKTVVDWALDEGFCVILNVHHDNYKESELNKGTVGYALSKDKAVQDKSKAFLSSVWKQIATTFADYDNRLVFEVLNEPRDIDGEVGGNEWWTNDKTLLNVITSYEQVCINQIRSVKGNEKRFVMAPSYAATSDTGIISLFTLPTDSAKDRLILSVHAYSPYDFAMKSPGDVKFTSAHKSSLDTLFAWLNTNYVKKGIGVVIGETGATNKNNLSDRIEWANAFFAGAYKYGIPAVLWDNGIWQVTGTKYDEHYGYYNRNSQTWYFPTLIEAMMKAVYGSSISVDNGGNDDNGTTTTDTPETPGDNTGTSTDNPSDTPKEDLVILENKSYTANGYSNFALDSAVDLTGYKYLKSEVQLITAEDADKKQILLQFFNCDWKKISEDAKTISVSATIYTEILTPESGPQDLLYIQPVVQETTSWSALTGVQLKIKKITATNTKE